MIKYKLLPSNISELLNRAAHYLGSRNDVAFAYLFGSLAKNRVFPMSDVDIAVYLKKGVSYVTSKMEILGDLMEILCTDEIDLVILNLTPISLTMRVLKNRKVIAECEPLLRQQFETLIMRKAFDFSILEQRILQRRYMNG